MKMRTALRLLTVAMLSVALTVPMASAQAGSRLVDQITLPNGFQPEGITIGPGPYAYFGSRADGRILAADLRTGRYGVINPGRGPGNPSVGLKSDQRELLYVAGGITGTARVINFRTGQELASYQLAPTGTTSFVNDVVITKRAAWFTDSRQAVLYRVPLARDGVAALQPSVHRIRLRGEWVQNADPASTNANGIAQTPDGRALLVVQTMDGLLFRVNPATGWATQVDLGGYDLTAGDGLLVLGRTLYVVRNRENLVAVIRLNREGTRGRLVEELTSPRCGETCGFDVPTTVAAYKGSLFLPNARFGQDQTGPFWVTRIDR